MTTRNIRTLVPFLFFAFSLSAQEPVRDNGYRLWLKYDRLTPSDYLQSVRGSVQQISLPATSATLEAAAEELQNGLTGLLGRTTPIGNVPGLTAPGVIAGTPASNDLIAGEFSVQLRSLPEEGYMIKHIIIGGHPCIAIAANDDTGVLYGVFAFLRALQTGTPLSGIDQTSHPRIQWRTLNHWDNADRSVERGYAGQSLWKWDELPGVIDPRYKDYARANASVGINTVVLNNVNSNPVFITVPYLKKVAALADIFRPYGIRVMLSANFASPVSIGNLPTADPLDPRVRRWWKGKADEIYRLIPDFGGLLVKANSEGQPGPKDYDRTHVDGANMLGEALAPHNGVVMWRAFVYGFHGPDRVKQAYDEFIGLDGEFADNVFLQIKNGPIDFQPREPFSPLFGAMPHTAEMMEFQITQEYLGFSTHLVYLAPLFKETLEADTYAEGPGSTVARVLDGTLQGQKMTGMAGVANTGSDTNWTGHPMAQANWYAFGRLAWDHELTPEQIAGEWIRMTLTRDTAAIDTILTIMMDSREALVNYETPLGLHVLCDGNHFSPRPEGRGAYHKADSLGIGFDRTSAGSDAVSQYFPPLRDVFDDIETCPEELLAWFHHVPWGHKMRSGRTFWEELCHKYYSGVQRVRRMQQQWATLDQHIDKTTFGKVKELLVRQEDEAVWWRDYCLRYFGGFSGQPIPDQYEYPRYPDGKRAFRVANMLQNNMVVQQDRPFRLWGIAPKGTPLSVQADWMDQPVRAEANDSLKWAVTIPVPEAIPGNFDQHSVEIIAGRDTVRLTNLLIGEVWVCGGQSNMEMSFLDWGKVDHYAAEIAAADHPGIRLFQARHVASSTPRDEIKGTWNVCSPETVEHFSAVAYFFGRELLKHQNIPVGLVHSSWGGSVAQAWTSAASLKTMPYFANQLEQLTDEAVYPVSGPQTLAEANQPSALFNGMIHPLLPLTIRGVIWFQGASNSNAAYQYRELFPLLINDWRRHWDQGEFPFYYVQLANLKFGAVNDVPKESFWSELREAQRMTLQVPHTGMAVTVDIGNPDDIHFGNKQEVGRRLALIARAKTYGEHISYSGPLFEGMKIRGHKAIISFKHTDRGLKSRADSVLTGFAMAGADRKFHWARARIRGDQIIVTCPEVRKPVAVRYGWANSPDCNLYNGAGLPASPFRTDDWPGVTYGKP